MRANVNPLQLLLDMKVRWGSTHVMLKRVLSRRPVSTTFLIFSYNILLNHLQYVDTFVYEMGRIAGDESIEKRRKIDSLRLTVGEWERVQTFENLLAVCTFFFSDNFTYLTLEYRQPIRRNIPSHIPLSQHYATLYQPSKNSMRHGKNNGKCQEQNRFVFLWMRRSKRLMTTM